MEVLKFVIDNWVVIIAMMSTISFVISAMVKFLSKPSSQQMTNLMEWLKIAVTEAEKEYGGGTGTLKLRAVYEAAVLTFPWMEKYVAFEKFAIWVDVALDWMREQLEENENIERYVGLVGYTGDNDELEGEIVVTLDPDMDEDEEEM